MSGYTALRRKNETTLGPDAKRANEVNIGALGDSNTAKLEIQHPARLLHITGADYRARPACRSQVGNLAACGRLRAVATQSRRRQST